MADHRVMMVLYCDHQSGPGEGVSVRRRTVSEVSGGTYCSIPESQSAPEDLYICRL